VPLFNPFFDTVPLSMDDWIFMIPFMIMDSIAAELLKIYFRFKAVKMLLIKPTAYN